MPASTRFANVLIQTRLDIEAVVNDYENSQAKLSSFSQSDYESIGLGKFIESKVLQEESTRKYDHPYAENSGTLKDKTGFARRALKHMNALADLSKEAVELGKRLLKFIEKHNC